MPQAEEPFLQGERLAAKAQGRGRLRQLLCAEEVSREVRPTELALGSRISQITGQPIAAESAGERGTEQTVQHVRAARWCNLIEDERARHQRPDPACVSVGPMAGLVAVEHALV